MNADDICAELAAARAYITRGDDAAAIECIDQAIRVWSAERDYWAHVERDAARGLDVVITPAREAAIQDALAELAPREQPVVWAKRHES